MSLGMDRMPSPENDTPVPDKFWDAGLHFLDRRCCAHTVSPVFKHETGTRGDMVCSREEYNGCDAAT